LTLVVDASFAVYACGRDKGFETLGDASLAAPALMWSEALSAIREARWRREIEAEDADQARRRLAVCPVSREAPPELLEQAWRLADELGWAKTYDAEYLALARLLDCKLVTVDARLRRGSARLGIVVGPEEL